MCIRDRCIWRSKPCLLMYCRGYCMIELDHEQLIYLRNTLTWLKQYVPYQERGDMPFHATVWYPYHQDLLDKVLNELEKYEH